MVSPKAYIMAIVAIIAVGIPAATQKAVLAFRKRKRSTSTSSSPRAPFSNRILRRPVMASARVLIRSTATPSGSSGDISSATSSTRRCRPMASPRSERSILIDTAGFSPT